MNTRLMQKIAEPTEQWRQNRSTGEYVLFRNGKPTGLKTKNLPAADDPSKAKPGANGLNINVKDVVPWASALGVGLLGHSLGSALIGDAPSDRSKKESAWERLLRWMIPLGIGGAGAYAGYRLGDMLKSGQANSGEWGEPIAATRGGKTQAIENNYQENKPSRLVPIASNTALLGGGALHIGSRYVRPWWNAANSKYDYDNALAQWNGQHSAERAKKVRDLASAKRSATQAETNYNKGTGHEAIYNNRMKEVERLKDELKTFDRDHPKPTLPRNLPAPPPQQNAGWLKRLSARVGGKGSPKNKLFNWITALTAAGGLAGDAVTGFGNWRADSAKENDRMAAFGK